MVTPPSSKLSNTAEKNRVRFNEDVVVTNTAEGNSQETLDPPLDGEAVTATRPNTLPPSLPSLDSMSSLNAKVAPSELLSFPYTFPLPRPSSTNHTAFVPPRELIFPTGLKLNEPRGQRARCLDIINSALDCLDIVDNDMISA